MPGIVFLAGWGLVLTSVLFDCVPYLVLDGLHLLFGVRWRRLPPVFRLVHRVRQLICWFLGGTGGSAPRGGAVDSMLVLYLLLAKV